MIRDLDYEHEFLTEAAKRATSRLNVPTDGFVVCVQRRLALGEQLYGNSYMLKDDAARALDIAEEAWDLGAYPALEAQVRIKTRTDSDSSAYHTFELATLAAAAHYHTRCLVRGDE